jgi:succinate dehydrogenase / fumarate reductase membrane anchor subunit
MSLHSLFGRILVLGSTKGGTGHWWGQRMTAIILIFVGLWFLVSILSLDNMQFDTVYTWAGKPLNSILLILTFASLSYHSKLGVQVIIEDYVHGSTIKTLSLGMNNFAHVLLAVVSVFAVLKISFGGL